MRRIRILLVAAICIAVPFDLPAQGVKQSTDAFKVFSPSGLGVSYLVLPGFPLSLSDGQGEHPVTAVLLAYQPKAIPWKCTFDKQQSYIKLSSGRTLPASHILFDSGWKIPLTPISEVRLIVLSPGQARSLTMSVSGKQIPTVVSVSLVMPFRGEMSRAGALLWFVFPDSGTQPIDEIHLGDVILRKQVGVPK